MTPAEAEIALGVLKLARLVSGQLALMGKDELTPEMRAELLATRDEVNARFDELMPRD